MVVKSVREACFKALLHAYRSEGYIADHLEEWRLADKPSEKDFRLAQEIAMGTMRMTRLLDHLGKQMTPNHRLPEKLKEKILFRMAIYQSYFMDRIPDYAIVNETVKLAKKFCHARFAGFLNASLRKLGTQEWKSPQGDDPESISIRLSYPIDFVEEMIDDYGIETAVEALEEMNTPPKLMGRKIGSFEMTSLEKPLEDNSIYIQNSTPVKLMEGLSEQTSCHPKRILDLCASPGGKTLLLHELFPDAKLFANDLTPQKVERLKENLDKYNVDAKTSIGPGEKYAANEPFDLIVLDVPCSNSGVLNKRAEARWRLTQDNLKELTDIQTRILKHAITLLAPQGEIWYMTCSILEKENHGPIEKTINNSLEIRYKKTILPDKIGADGGFCAIIKA